MQERTPEGGTGVSWSETTSRHTRLREDEGFQLSVRFRIQDRQYGVPALVAPRYLLPFYL
jgi:hypothetical protein